MSTSVADSTPLQTATRPPTRLPGLLLGIGFGGFVDGILLHQVLQWHHMLTGTGDHPMDTVAGLEVNTLADGFFHVATWVFVVVGSMLMLRAWRQGRIAPTWSFQIGLLLAGWGVFNLVEGLVNHQLLGIHHVRDDLGGPLSWDLAFLASGVVLIAAGWALHKKGERGLPD
jgi:uncharacterized membrane protein